MLRHDLPTNAPCAALAVPVACAAVLCCAHADRRPYPQPPPLPARATTTIATPAEINTRKKPVVVGVTPQPVQPGSHKVTSLRPGQATDSLCSTTQACLEALCVCKVHAPACCCTCAKPRGTHISGLLPAASTQWDQWNAVHAYTHRCSKAVPAFA